MITFPNNTVEIIDEIRGAIGRDVLFYMEDVSPCSGCDLDPNTNTSTNSWCPLCSGAYWITTYSGVTVSGHITWGQADILNWYSAGQMFDGDCRIQIKLTDENAILVDECKWLEADGKKLEIKKKIFRGVQPLNRIILYCIELNKEV
jgi:hypothetical protein